MANWTLGMSAVAPGHHESGQSALLKIPRASRLPEALKMRLNWNWNVQHLRQVHHLALAK
ncbi:hypothetical protein NEUTE2DRAFT_130481 [Neurospora tetrasperma FGSC 2509]|nr:hypothetical protein NEUTE2DRAFT_130481 [Neurospora tetrasperma FGSC 2509]